MRSITELKARAKQIREATQEGENTASRVGGLFVDIIDHLDGEGGDNSSLSITSYLSKGTKIASFDLDGEVTNIYAPASGGNGGSTVIENPYDDSDIKKAIDQLNDALKSTSDLANSEKARLDGVIKDIDDNVKGKMQDAIDFASWIQGNFPQGDTTYKAGWNDKTKEYLQVVGMWDTSTDSPVVTTTKWSKLNQTVDKIALDVTSIAAGEGVTTEMLQGWINVAVENGIAGLNLGTTYASKDAENVLEWMYSALTNNSSSDKTFNQIVSAGKSGTTSAISEIRTYVEKLENGDYVATADFETKVNDSITGLYSKATANDATTTIFSQVKKDSEDIAAIVQSITGDSSSTTIANKIANWKAGLVTQANLNNATAGLVASDDYNAATILAMINGDESTAKISADKIEFSGQEINAIITSGLYINNGKPAGQGNKNYIISANDRSGFSIESRGSSADISIFNIDTSGNIVHTYNGSETFAFGREGNGYLANGNLSWGADGDLVIRSSKQFVDEFGTETGETVTIDFDESLGLRLQYSKNGVLSNRVAITPTGKIIYNSFEFNRVTIGSSTYMYIGPRSMSNREGINSALLMRTDGRLGVWHQGAFVEGYDAPTGDLDGFINHSGSTLSNYTVINGLIVSKPQ